MNILHAISSANTAGGGPIETVRLLGIAHQRAGHQVEVASLDPPGVPAVPGTIAAPGVPAVPRDSPPALPFPLHALGPGWSKYAYAPRMLQWLRANHRRFDAVLVHGLWQYHSFAVWQALHRTPAPYYVFPHGMLDPWFKRRYPLKHLKKQLYWPWADYRVLRDARSVFFTCEEERLLAPQSFSLYRARAVVAGLGAASPPVNPDLARLAFLQQFPQLSRGRLALFMGRLHPKKGCDLLLEAFAQTLARDPEWRLVMAGPDQLGWQRDLQQLAARLGIAERVIWTGMLSGEVKWGALAAAECFALPSHQENFGIAVAEALACGTPVLISRQVNIWREIAGSQAGLVADDTLAGTTDLFAQWHRLSPAEREGMRQRAVTCFQDHFDIERCAAGVLDLITSNT